MYPIIGFGNLAFMALVASSMLLWVVCLTKTSNFLPVLNIGPLLAATASHPLVIIGMGNRFTFVHDTSRGRIDIAPVGVPCRVGKKTTS